MPVPQIGSAPSTSTNDLLGRIVSILDGARGQVVRAVNQSMITAYWHIGREVVEELQRGNQRADYGRALIGRLAEQLTARYGKGFSATNLAYFRQFYLAYRNRILHPAGGELAAAFNPNLTWSHYRALMRVTNPPHVASTKPKRCVPTGRAVTWIVRSAAFFTSECLSAVPTKPPSRPVTNRLRH